MERVALFSLKTEQIKVIIEAYFDTTGNLVIEGYDIGKTVEEYWGDSDYEYSTTIQPGEVKKLSLALNLTPGSKAELLNYLQTHYNQNDCYSKIQKLLTHHQIKSEGFSWR
jgi:hypothetical protein